MKNLKHIIYLFTILLLFISCENNTKKPDIKKTNTSEVNRPTPNNTELEKKIVPIDNGENLLFQRLMFNEQTALFASSLTSLATTAKPLPASPALAASIVALSASRLVCSAIESMTLITLPMSLLEVVSLRT